MNVVIGAVLCYIIL